jgi:hypothetical protein
MPDDPTESVPPNLPKPGAAVELQHCQIQLGFYPPIQLIKKQAGQKFGLALCDHLAIEKQEFESHKWEFTASFYGSPECQLQIAVAQNNLAISLKIPANHPQEWVEQRFLYVLDKFTQEFTPQVLLGLIVTTAGISEIAGDARAFLAEKLMRLEGDRVGLFGRPLHLVGLHLFFPPCSVPGPDGTTTDWPWAEDVKVESLMTDPSKVWVTASATWNDGVPWSEAVPQEVIKRLATATSHFKGCIAQFITKETDSSGGVDNAS